MNNINPIFTKYIDELDNEIIKLFSIRKNYKTNTKLYKSPDLSNLKNNTSNNNNISIIDLHIYNYEKNNIKEHFTSYQKLFNPLLIKKKII